MALVAVIGLYVFGTGAESASGTLPGKNGLLSFSLPLPYRCPPPVAAPPGNSCYRQPLFTVTPLKGHRVPFRQVCTPRSPCVTSRPTVSPDGTSVAYSEFREVGEPHRVVVAAAKGANARVIAEDAADPAWSPDGRLIAFLEPTDGGISIMRTDGTGRRQIMSRSAFTLDWSSRNVLVFVPRLGDPRASWIYVIRPNGTGLRRVTRGTDPSWSPDGRRLAYICPRGRTEPRRVETSTDICTIRADGENRRRVLRRARSPAWSPDGRRIAFVGFNKGTVATARSDGTGRRAVFRADRRFPSALSWLPAVRKMKGRVAQGLGNQ